uniref:Uncharacterized protein n=1 Tax=Anguilla anguilla TaxID=7936 RepID=A0A0E9PRJ3_ANGAN
MQLLEKNSVKIFFFCTASVLGNYDILVLLLIHH